MKISKNTDKKYIELLKKATKLTLENDQLKRQVLELCYSKTDVTQAQYDAVVQQNKELQQELNEALKTLEFIRTLNTVLQSENNRLLQK